MDLRVRRKNNQMLAKLWRDQFEKFTKNFVRGGIHRPVADGLACGISAKIVPGFPIIFWTNGARTKAATAIGAHVIQNVIYTGPAEGTFKRAYHRRRGIRRQRRIAIFASRPQLKHGFKGCWCVNRATFGSILWFLLGRSAVPARAAAP